MVLAKRLWRNPLGGVNVLRVLVRSGNRIRFRRSATAIRNHPSHLRRPRPGPFPSSNSTRHRGARIRYAHRIDGYSHLANDTHRTIWTNNPTRLVARTLSHTPPLNPLSRRNTLRSDRTVGPLVPKRKFPMALATSCAATVILGSLLPFISSDIQLTQTTDLYFVKNNSIIDKCITSLALTIKLLFFVSPSHRLYWSILLVVNALVMIVGLWRNRSLGIWIALLMTPIATMLLVDVLRETNQSAMTRYAAAASACAASGPILASFAIHRWLGWGQTLLLLTLALLEFDSPRDIGSPQFHAMSSEFSPIIASLPKETPVVSASSTGYPVYYRRALLLEWKRFPGFLPRNIMSLEQPTAESVQSLAAATPEKRFWLIKPGITSTESTRIEWIQARFPSAKLIPPVHTLQPGHQGIQPEPPMELMLLELNE